MSYKLSLRNASAPEIVANAVPVFRRTLDEMWEIAGSDVSRERRKPKINKVYLGRASVASAGNSHAS